MKFSYTAVDANNKVQKGVTEAPSLKDATRLLLEQGWFIKNITPENKLKHGLLEMSFGGIKLMDKVLFAKHIGTMVSSGISLNESLVAIGDQTTSKKFKKIIKSVAESVQSGQSFAHSLEQYPSVFDPFFVNIVRIGEESGTLAENLQYLASELEDQVDLRRKIKAASLYPSIVLFLTFSLGVILSYFVLPKINELFKNLQFELPLSTKILLFVADVVDKYGLILLAVFIGGLIGLKFLIKTPQAKPVWHAFLLKIPALGTVLRHYNLTVISRTMSILLKSGLTIDQSLNVTHNVTNNVSYKKILKKMVNEVQHGQRLSSVIERFRGSGKHPLFPLLTIKMISVGERSGKLDESFGYLATFYEKEVDNSTQGLTAVLEPILLIIVGLVVAFVAVSVIAPIYKITSDFRQ